MKQLPHGLCPAAGHDRAICHGHSFHCPLSVSRDDCTAIALPLEDVIQRLSQRTTCSNVSHNEFWAVSQGIAIKPDTPVNACRNKFHGRLKFHGKDA